MSKEQTKDKNNEQKQPKPKNKFKVAFIVFLVVSIVSLIGNGVMAFFLFEPYFINQVSKKEFYALVGDDCKIPIIEINTKRGKEPKNKVDYVNCSFQISNTGSDEQNFFVSMKEEYGDEDSVGIRLRGNSTMKAVKKPYRIKFDKKKSLLGLEKSKSWVLLADYYDQSKIRNYTAFTLAQSLTGLDFTPHPNHVALIINNEFKGLYLLTEQIDENKGRTQVEEDIDTTTMKEFPFLVEMDELAYKEGKTGVDNFTIPGLPAVEIKYPEKDERNLTSNEDVVFNYIREYISAVYTLLQNGGTVEVSFRDNPVSLTDLVDVNSLIDFYFMNEIMLNYDASSKSIYMHKTANGLLEFGPIWDFDASTRNEWVKMPEKSYIETARTIYIAKHNVMIRAFLQNENNYNLVANRYDEIKESILNTADHLRDYKSKIDNVALIDAEIYYGKLTELKFDTQYDYVRLFLMDRYDYLDEVFNYTHADFLQLL